MNPIITILLGVIALLALIVFLVTFIYFLIDNFSNKNRSIPEKILWLIAVLLIGFLPVFIYFFVNKKTKLAIISLVSFLLIPGTLMLYAILNFISIHQNNGALYFSNNYKEAGKARTNIDKSDFDPNKKSWHGYDIVHRSEEEITKNPYGEYTLGGSKGILVIRETDFDGDGLSNDLEKQCGTDPNYPDSDGDGVVDGDEVKYGLNPLGDGKLNVKQNPLPIKWSVFNYGSLAIQYPSDWKIDTDEDLMSCCLTIARIFTDDEKINIWIKTENKDKNKNLADWIDETFDFTNLIKNGGPVNQYLKLQKTMVGNLEGYKSFYLVGENLYYFIEMPNKTTVYHIWFTNTNFADPNEDIYNEIIKRIEFK